MKIRVVIALLLLASSAAAQSPVETIPPGDDKIVPVAVGEKAPFTGQLFDPPTALRWANWLQQYKLRLKQDVSLEKSVCEAKQQYSEKLLKIEQERASSVEKDLRDRLLRAERARLLAEEEARNPPWYRSTWFGVTTGVVATSVVFGLSVWAVDSTR